jgi:hypothetical protein
VHWLQSKDPTWGQLKNYDEAEVEADDWAYRYTLEVLQPPNFEDSILVSLPRPPTRREIPSGAEKYFSAKRISSDIKQVAWPQDDGKKTVLTHYVFSIVMESDTLKMMLVYHRQHLIGFMVGKAEADAPTKIWSDAGYSEENIPAHPAYTGRWVEEK